MREALYYIIKEGLILVPTLKYFDQILGKGINCRFIFAQCGPEQGGGDNTSIAKLMVFTSLKGRNDQTLNIDFFNAII